MIVNNGQGTAMLLLLDDTVQKKQYFYIFRPINVLVINVNVIAAANSNKQ